MKLTSITRPLIFLALASYCALGQTTTSGPNPSQAAEVARAEHAPFMDLNEIIAARYDTMGSEKVNPLFADEHTHTTRAGAKGNAECVIAGWKALPDNPLTPYLKK